MGILFLDIDGVLNSKHTRETTSEGWVFVSDYLLRNLAKVIDETGFQVVLSSSWRFDWNPADNSHNTPSFNELLSKFSEYKIKLIDKTGDFKPSRGLAIREWLNHHPEVGDEFIIIDDWDDMGAEREHLVLTNPDDGLDAAKVKEAIDLAKKFSEGATA